MRDIERRLDRIELHIRPYGKVWLTIFEDSTFEAVKADFVRQTHQKVTDDEFLRALHRVGITYMASYASQDKPKDTWIEKFFETERKMLL